MQHRQLPAYTNTIAQWHLQKDYRYNISSDHEAMSGTEFTMGILPFYALVCHCIETHSPYYQLNSLSACCQF